VASADTGFNNKLKACHQGGQKMKNYGFTLYELLITLIVIAITLVIGLPGLNKTIQNTRTKTAALELLAAIEQARSIAVFTNTRSVLAAKVQWHSGWNIFLDADDDGIFDPDEKLITEQGPLDAVIIKGNYHVRELISFISTGEGRNPGRANAGAFTTGTLTICPIIQGAGYSIILSKGGRSRINTLTKEECSQIQ
jgi:type IV fimbrial biogenesis protein FimT